MRIVLVVLLAAAALWQAWIDWQATIGAGYAYRLTSIGAALERAAPERHAALVGTGEGGLAWLWSPILALPLALTLLVLAGVIWLTRGRRPRGF